MAETVKETLDRLGLRFAIEALADTRAALTSPLEYRKHLATAATERAIVDWLAEYPTTHSEEFEAIPDKRPRYDAVTRKRL